MAPVERERMALSVERALVLLDRVAHYIDFLAEVYVLCQLGVEGGLSAVHSLADSFEPMLISLPPCAHVGIVSTRASKKRLSL